MAAVAFTNASALGDRVVELLSELLSKPPSERERVLVITMHHKCVVIGAGKEALLVRAKHKWLAMMAAHSKKTEIRLNYRLYAREGRLRCYPLGSEYCDV
jgi:hypothetical protein